MKTKLFIILLLLFISGCAQPVRWYDQTPIPNGLLSNKRDK